MDVPQNLNEAVSYQEGSVVSREIVKKPTGTVTLFAFAKDQGLSEHTTPYDGLVIVTDGAAEITVDGTAYTVSSGEQLLLPAGHPHALKALQPFKMLLVMIRS